MHLPYSLWTQCFYFTENTWLLVCEIHGWRNKRRVFVLIKVYWIICHPYTICDWNYYKQIHKYTEIGVLQTGDIIKSGLVKRVILNESQYIFKWSFLLVDGLSKTHLSVQQATLWLADAQSPAQSHKSTCDRGLKTQQRSMVFKQQDAQQPKMLWLFETITCSNRTTRRFPLFYYFFFCYTNFCFYNMAQIYYYRNKINKCCVYVCV